jgi:signal peptidase I
MPTPPATPRKSAPSSKSSAKKSTAKKPASPFNLITLVKEYGPVVIAVVLINTFAIQAYGVPTGSMENTILIGDHFWVGKFIYGAKIPFTDIRLPGLREVQQNDIVVFVQPRTGENYIKRCVAAGGSTIEIRNKQLYINGQPSPLSSLGKLIGDPLPANVAEPNIFPQYAPFNKDNYGPLYVPKKGDTLALSTQSFTLYKWVLEYEGHKVTLSGGKVYIDGVAQTSYVTKQNYYFMMGDNRDNSLDSRYWGFVPESNIVGSPLIVYWSWNTDISWSNPVERFSSIRWNRIGTTFN